MDTEPIQENPESLDSLQPTEGSLPWLRQKGETRKIKQLEDAVTDAIEKLSKYKDIFLTQNDILEYYKLAAKAGSTLLQDWAEFNQYYSYPPIDIEDLSDRVDLKQADVDLYRNLAVIARDEAIQLKNKNMNEKANEKMEYSRRNYAIYQRLSNNSGIHHYSATGAITELLAKAEIVSLLFNPAIITAQKELDATIDDIYDNKGDLPEIDSGLIRVCLRCSVSKKDFPFVHDEFEKLQKYFADKNNVSVEDMERFTAWRVKQMFSD